jgi:transcriptional regulator with XRE-family HTH domain
MPVKDSRPLRRLRTISSPRTVSTASNELVNRMNNPEKLNIVGPQLQLLRKWRGWSQNHLSIKLCSLGWKVSRGSIAQMEITTKRITDFDLIFLAKALGVKVTDFFPATFSQQNLWPKIKSRRLMKSHQACLRCGKKKQQQRHFRQ